MQHHRMVLKLDQILEEETERVLATEAGQLQAIAEKGMNVSNCREKIE